MGDNYNDGGNGTTLSNISSSGDYRTKDIGWNITYAGNGSPPSNDISFNLTNLDSNTYYKYYYNIKNTLNTASEEGLKHPNNSNFTGNTYLTAPGKVSLDGWNNSDYSHDLSNISKIELNFPDKKELDLKEASRAFLEDRLVDVSWSYRGLTVTDISLNRPMGDYYNSNKEEFGHSVAISGDGKTIAVGAPYFSANLMGLPIT